MRATRSPRLPSSLGGLLMLPQILRCFPDNGNWDGFDGGSRGEEKDRGLVAAGTHVPNDSFGIVEPARALLWIVPLKIKS